jgi:hypothetical protein
MYTKLNIYYNNIFFIVSIVIPNLFRIWPQVSGLHRDDMLSPVKLNSVQHRDTPAVKAAILGVIETILGN